MSSRSAALRGRRSESETDTRSRSSVRRLRGSGSVHLPAMMLLTLVAGCGLPSVVDPTEIPPPPSDLPALTRIAAPDGSFSAKVPARLQTPIHRGRQTSLPAWVMQFDVGAKIGIDCVLFDNEDPLLAASLRELGRQGRSALEAMAGTKLAVELRRAGAGHFDDVPFLAAEWGVGGDAEAIGVRGLSAVKNRRGITCLQFDGLNGNRFFALARSLIETIELPDPTAGVFRRELFTYELEGKPVGVGTIHLSRDGDGDVAFQQANYIVIARPHRIRSVDELRFDYSTEAGELINGAYRSYVNGELEREARLDPVAPNTWSIVLRKGDSSRRFEITSEESPVGWYGYVRAITERLRPGDRISRLRWSPSTSTHDRFVRTTATIDALQEDGAFAGSAVREGDRSRIRVTRDGSVDTFFGDQAIRRVWSEGRYE